MRKVNPEYAKAIMAIANRAPYLKLLGMKICELDYGYCRVETQINDSLNNPFASVHGGVFSSILDTATFWALYCCIGEEDGITTLDLQVNNLAAAASGKIIAEGRLIRMGRTIGLAEGTLKDENGKVASMGYCYESYGIIVNKKLLKKAGYEITDIKDFASLKSVAEDIHKRADKLGFDAFTSSGMDDASSWRFTGHLANMPLFYEGRDDGWKEAPAEIKGTYLDNFKNVWDLYINNSKYDKKTLATGGYDAEAEFKKGEAVFYQNGTWEYDALKKSISDDDMQMIPIYCGVEGEEKAGLCSGTENCWAVNAKASKADQKATLEFMKWLVTSKEGTKVMAEQFGAIPYKKAADSGNVFLKNANDLLEAGNYNVDWSFNYTPNVDEWRASLVAAMNKYDAGGSWDDVKTAFVQGWATQYKAANK